MKRGSNCRATGEGTPHFEEILNTIPVVVFENSTEPGNEGSS